MGPRIGRASGIPVGGVAGVPGRIALIEGGEAASDALEGLDALPLELDQDARGIGVRTLADVLGLRLTRLDDLARSKLSGARQLPLLDEEGGLLLRSREDALGLLLGALDQPARLLVDALGLPDLLRYGHAQLVDEIERGHLIHDHGVGHGHAAAVGHEGLETLDQEDDVDD
jgi:hypothetical protein